MNSLINALASSVGRKFVMGLTGLFLCFFLVIHLAGNLLMYVGAETYNTYAHTLHNQQAFLIFSQVLLYVAFLLHLVIAFKLTATNLAARRNNYQMKQSKQTGRALQSWIAPEVWMFWTGVVVLAFLMVHLCDFKFGLSFSEQVEGKEPYDRVTFILQNSAWRQGMYVAGAVLLGVHVSHGFASCFQSLGISHPNVNCCLKWCSIVFAWIVAIGFASFPLAIDYLAAASSSP